MCVCVCVCVYAYGKRELLKSHITCDMLLFMSYFRVGNFRREKFSMVVVDSVAQIVNP